jgi:hypothetical protein
MNPIPTNSYYFFRTRMSVWDWKCSIFASLLPLLSLALIEDRIRVDSTRLNWGKDENICLRSSIGYLYCRTFFLFIKLNFLLKKLKILFNNILIKKVKQKNIFFFQFFKRFFLSFM